MANNNKNASTLFDTIIIGGSYAGLSAALALGRSTRSVLIIDNGQPCNRQTPMSHNFLTRDGIPPSELSMIAREQVLQYPTVHIIDGLAAEGRATEFGFDIVTDENHTYRGKKLVFATGIQDHLPNINGLADCWGISVIHCPYCHGYEYKKEKTAIIANSERAFHLATLVSNLTPDLTIFTNGKALLDDLQLAILEKNGILIIDNPIAEIAHNDGHVTHVVLDDGKKIRFSAVYAAVPFTQQSTIPLSLGCELTEPGYLKVDAMQKTSISGVFACGDNSSGMRTIANAVYTGCVAGAVINAELASEKFKS